MGAIKDFMARRCDKCPICRYAREHPDRLVSKAVAFHGKFCPFWRAWEQVYGQQAQADISSKRE
ncbi:MAG: hypothetical protein JXR96_21860 [Deltaproteobacteria bacterium]|nr:hypothetical protein [Deltaproteobacteria bacterium]